MVYELIAFSTEERGEASIRYRQYTNSEIKAEAWARMPRIDFTDSYHGIVFASGPKPAGERKTLKPLRWGGDLQKLFMKLQEDIRAERRKAKRERRSKKEKS